MKIYILMLLFIIISGCKVEHDLMVVDCDSGFSTGNSAYAGVDDGSIIWKDIPALTWHTRKMIPGEICTMSRVAK